MRVLVITRSSWRTDNSIGNSFDNFFKDWDDTHFYNISLRDEPTLSDIPLKSFHVSETQIIKGLKNKRYQVGQIETASKANEQDNVHLEKRLKSLSVKNSLGIDSIAQELLWSLNTWKNERLKNYVMEIAPDIIFMPVFPKAYPHKLLKYLHSITNARVILFHADDTYTLRQFNLNPLYWLHRFYLRKWVRNSVRISDLDYMISDIQREEYGKALNIEGKILYKCGDFSKTPDNTVNENIELLFTGNINLNRWKTIIEIGKAVDELSDACYKLHFDIYTRTEMTKEMKKAFDSLKHTQIKGSISYSEVVEIQKKADILVHVEAYDLKNRLAVHQSFSTKIVDYLEQGKCILAVGPADVASIDYLKKNDAALVIADKNDIMLQLKNLMDNKELIKEYGQKAWECGKRNHQLRTIQSMLKNDFNELITNK